MWSRSMFPQIDALPCTQSAMSICDGNGEVHICEDGANMRRHVVRTLLTVLEHRIAIGYQPDHKGFEIAAYRRVGVFAQDQ